MKSPKMYAQSSFRVDDLKKRNDTSNNTDEELSVKGFEKNFDFLKLFRLERQ